MLPLILIYLLLTMLELMNIFKVVQYEISSIKQIIEFNAHISEDISVICIHFSVRKLFPNFNQKLFRTKYSSS